MKMMAIIKRLGSKKHKKIMKSIRRGVEFLRIEERMRTIIRGVEF
jgi:hypothetical protein